MSVSEATARNDSPLWFYTLLGSLVSAFAIASLIAKIADVGLAPVMQQTIEFYRNLVHPVASVLISAVEWLVPNLKLPDWFKDLYAASFVGGAVAGRAWLLSRERSLIVYVRSVLLAAVVGLSLGGLAIVLLWLAQTMLLPLMALFGARRLVQLLGGSGTSRLRRVVGSLLSLWTIFILWFVVSGYENYLLWRRMLLPAGQDGLSLPGIGLLFFGSILPLITLYLLLRLLIGQFSHDAEVRGEPLQDTFVSRFTSHASILMPFAVLGAALFFALNARL